MAIDPVCKMQVEPETAAAQAEYEGRTYYFCAPGCKAAFERDPDRYLKGAGEEGGHHAGHSRVLVKAGEFLARRVSGSQGGRSAARNSLPVGPLR